MMTGLSGHGMQTKQAKRFGCSEVTNYEPRTSGKVGEKDYQSEEGFGYDGSQRLLWYVCGLGEASHPN